MATREVVPVEDFDLAGLLSTAKPFRAFAEYDREMDCIRVYFRDCSTFERRLNDYFTFFYDNYPKPNQRPIVGLSLKGVNATLKQLGLSHRTVYPLAYLIDSWAKMVQPDQREELDRILVANSPIRDIDLPVDLTVPAYS